MSTQKNPCILMVEDEQDVLKINVRILQRRGYDVLTAATCKEALALLSDREPDLLILDIMLPDGSGFDICQQFRRSSDHPVIFLTGKNQVSDKTNGLEKGGDYYITKPYDPDELLAIAGRLLQRHMQLQQKHKELTVLQKGSLLLDIPKARATVNGADAGLTSKEFALLLALVRQEGQEISPHDLYEAVWGVPSMDDIRTVRTHIKNLRRKIGADDANDYDIVSSYGKGYTFTTLR